MPKGVQKIAQKSRTAQSEIRNRSPVSAPIMRVGKMNVSAHDVQAPIRGGGECADPNILDAALLEIARQLGHNRTAITCAYLGSPHPP